MSCGAGKNSWSIVPRIWAGPRMGLPHAFLERGCCPRQRRRQNAVRARKLNDAIVSRGKRKCDGGAAGMSIVRANLRFYQCEDRVRLQIVNLCSNDRVTQEIPRHHSRTNLQTDVQRVDLVVDQRSGLGANANEKVM